jgi:hypothetical protein
VGMRTTLTLWQPPDEAIEAFAAVLSSRWSAARSHPGGALFWPSKTNWLGAWEQARRLADNSRELAASLMRHHRTSGGRLIK